MTTNARDEKWSEWIPVYRESDMPTDRNVIGQWKADDGYVSGITPLWDVEYGGPRNVIAYRYKIKEPETTFMHEDLYWLAKNVNEWPDDYLSVRRNKDFTLGYCFTKRDDVKQVNGWYTREECHAARQQLGLDSGGIADPEEEECIQLAYERIKDESVPTSIKQLRYQDAKGEDWIDEFARTASVDEFRGAMRFTLGKYNRRAGKKDEIIKEIEKMRDYCDRWIEYERSL